MDQKTISLLKLDPPLQLTNDTEAALSFRLKHLCVVPTSKNLGIYSLSTGVGACHTLVWQSSKPSYRFSDDGKYLLIILETRTIQIYSLDNSKVTLLVEIDPLQLKSLLECITADLRSAYMKIVSFTSAHLVLLMERRWMIYIGLKLSEPLEPLTIKVVAEISSCVAFQKSKQYAYCLTEEGNLLVYFLESAKQVAAVNLCSLLHGSENENTLNIFTGLAVSEDGMLMAVSDVCGKVYFAKLQDCFGSYSSEERRYKDDDASSTVSVSSGTSFTSISTVGSRHNVPSGSLVDSVSIYTMDISERKKPSRASLWHSYLALIKDPSAAFGPKRKPSTISTADIMQMVDISKAASDHSIKSLHITAAGLVLWHTKAHEQRGGLYQLYSLTTGKIIVEFSVPEDALMIPGGYLGIMDAFLSPTSLWLFLGNLSKELVITKLLQCMDTESIVCLQNAGEWKDLMVPLPALIEGLRHNHMDIPRLALTLHSEAFKSSFCKTPAESDINWQARVQNLSFQMEQLFAAAHDILKRGKQMSNFLEQLILLYLEHANDLLQFLCDIDSTDSFVEKKVNLTMKQIMLHVVELRGYLRKASGATPISDALYQPLECLDEHSKAQWHIWLVMEDEEIILDAASKDSIPLLETFLHSCRGWKAENILHRIRRYVSITLEDLLKNGEIKKAEKLLINIGTDPHEELKNICLQTSDCSLRDNLAKYLSQNGLLTASELEAWNFIRLIENVIQAVSVSERNFSAKEILPYPRLIPAVDASEIYKNSDHLSVYTILRQSSEWKAAVTVELYFNTFEAELENLVEAETVWQYLLYINREDMILSWINSFYSKYEDRSEHTIMAQNNLEQKLPLLLRPEIQRMFSVSEITQSMIDTIHVADSMKTTKEKFLDYLSRHGAFTTNEQQNPSLILARLCRTQNLMHLKYVLNLPSANLSYFHFQELFIKYCIQYQCHNIFFSCLQKWDCSKEILECVMESLSIKDKQKVKWFRFFLQMKNLNGNWSDESLLYQAVHDMVICISNEQISSYLEHHPLIVLALIIYGKKQVNKVLKSDSIGEFAVDAQILQAAIEQLPVLKMALTYQKRGISQQPTITVYQLLQDCSPFSVAKIFCGQEGIRGKEGEYPHFSSEKLASKYGHKEILTFLYYLKQEQPSFAVNMFVIDQLRIHKRISKRMKKQACNLAHGLALKDFTKENIVCSCISFIEMLGADSGSVKVHVAAANKILSHFSSSVLDGGENNGSHQALLGALLHGLVQKNVHAAQDMLSHLETTLLHNANERRDSTAVESILHWNIAVKFSRIHNINLPELFLKECTKLDDWFSFILFIYIHQYPVQQVIQLIKQFHSSELQEHLAHAVAHIKEEHIRKLREKGAPRDTRSMLYSRLRLLKDGSRNDFSDETSSPSIEAIQASSSSSEESYQPRKTTFSSAETSIYDTTSKDIFHTLLICHRSQDPPQALLTACHSLHNPLLAVLATCYEPSSVLACFCSWLMTSLATNIEDEWITSFRSSIEDQIWTAEQMEQLMQQAVRDRQLSVLSRGFQLFFPDYPLCAFSSFLNECIQKKHFKESAVYIKAFKADYLNLKSSVVTVNYDMIGAFLNNTQWISSVAVKLTCAALANCFSSSFHELQFLRVICETGFSDFLSVQSVDFKLLHQLGECLSETGISPEWSALCCSGEERCQELMRCMNKLIEAKKYQQALDFVTLAGLSKESVVIAQWTEFFQEAISTQKHKTRSNAGSFWYMCNEAFIEAKVNPKTAVRFFRDHAGKVCSFIERFHVLKLALTWLRSSDDLSLETGNNASTEKLVPEKIELEMWKCLLINKSELEQVSTEVIVSDKPRMVRCLKKELLESSGVLSLAMHETVNDEEQLNCLNLLIGRLLDEGDIYTALRLESIFNHSNQDLQLLLMCMSLAEGELLHHQLTAEQKLLLVDTNSTPSGLFKRRALQSLKHASFSSSRVSSQSDSLDHSSSSELLESSILEKQDTLMVLEKLLEHVQHGRQVGNRIICCYRAAVSLERSYQEILSLVDPISLLKCISAELHVNKIVVASDLISAAQISREQIAELLCEEVVAAISRSQTQDDAFEGITIWGSDAEQNFHLIIELCDDPSILGTKFLNVATHIGATQPEAIKEVVEILIRSHECYTAACNMEGIAAVLHLAQTLTETLLLRQEWALMVHLLTGIGRYTEMNYIFQILKNNEQFEFLLGKGLDKKPNLKLAVLDFLKQYCPEDRELFRLVALHFTMYSEVAILWENEGQEVISTVLNLARLKQPVAPTLLTNTEDTKKLLNTIIVNFTHAAEYFLQAKKLNRAMAAANQAELAALQISLINSVPAGQETDCLLHLEPSEVDNMIINKLSFPQACLIARAYSHPVDWGATLYQQCIVQAKTHYLSEFMYSMTLTTALVEDVARRFQRETEVTQEMANQMKKFVLGVLNVEVKYRIASQLGFRDVIENLITGSELPYLKDTVWRSGFTSQYYPT